MNWKGWWMFLLWIPLFSQDRDVLHDYVKVQARAVPVYAMDNSGNPVTDLKPEEIAFYVNGKKIQLDLFVRRGFESEISSRIQAAPAELKPAISERIVFLIIEPGKLELRNLNRLKEILKGLVMQGKAGDKFVILTFEGAGNIHVIAGPEKAGEELIGKIDEFKMPIIFQFRGYDTLEYMFHLFPQPKVVYLFLRGEKIRMQPRSNISNVSSTQPLTDLLRKASAPVFTINLNDFSTPSQQILLKNVAEENGGRYLGSNKIPELIETIRRQENAYYEAIFDLSKVPEAKRYHVEINCLRPGVRIQTLTVISKTKEYSELSRFEKELLAADILSGGNWSSYLMTRRNAEFITERSVQEDKVSCRLDVRIPEEMVACNAHIYMIRTNGKEEKTHIKRIDKKLDEMERLEIKGDREDRMGFVIIEESGRLYCSSWLD